ncbi:hypothetical protein C8Q79DRAFT_980828 [Trametes meyenii]|nr:hypothetical protein C8Q79DRAFT_980828 [Trametes meyenii]
MGHPAGLRSWAMTVTIEVFRRLLSRSSMLQLCSEHGETTVLYVATSAGIPSVHWWLTFDHNFEPITLYIPPFVMTSAATGRSAREKTTNRAKPYNRSRRTKNPQASSVSPQAAPSSRVILPSSALPTPSLSSSASNNPPTPAGTALSTTRALPTMRELSVRVVQKHFPSYVAQNDWELLELSGPAYQGDESGIRDYLDALLVSRVEEDGSYENVMSNATRILDDRVECTGMKPSPGDPQVFVQAIPDSQYSIRLFPGSLHNSEYCLDFVDSRTGEPVNSPFKFDLICLPSPNAPIGSGPMVGMRPLECAFGMEADKIPPGEEKFLFRDGQHCILRRPGLRDVRFTIPIRRRPQAVLPTPDAHFLEFPEYID